MRSAAGWKVTERDLRVVARAIKQGNVRRRTGHDLMDLTVFQKGQPRIHQLRCEAKTRVLEERGHAVLGGDLRWSLTADGIAWLAAAGESGGGS